MPAPISILLVDDDAGLRGVLASCLRVAGHFVTEAGNGALAFDTLDTGLGPQLIILDLEMPVMDGPEFLARKLRGVYADMPVIIFSSSCADGLESLRGVIGVVAKCEGIASLLAAIPAAGSAASPAGADDLNAF